MPRWTSLGAAIALSLVVAACAPNADTGFPSPEEIPTEEPVANCLTPDEEPVELDGQIVVLDNCFRPQHAMVEAGQEIVWHQEGLAPHNVVFVEEDVNSHPDCSFNDAAACMGTGDEFRHTFDTPGELAYYCVLHGSPQGAGMAGTIIVA